jgi:membrane-associated protease RseP (regulator of RpoE activity)
VTVLTFAIGLLVIVVGLAISIALHEVGHLVPAKLFGVRVGRYMIGLGPTLWSRKFGETEYGIKALPIGGYISMSGMYPPTPAEREAEVTRVGAQDADGGGAAAPPRQGRTAGMFAAMIQDARVANEETMIGTADTRTFYRLPVYKRIIIMLGGPVMNLLLAILLFMLVFSGIGVQSASTSVAAVSECVVAAGSEQTECGPDDPASPAAAAGILPGDRILSIDGAPVATFDEASAIIRDNPGTRLNFEIERDGAQQTLAVTPLLAERPVYDDTGQPVVDADGVAETQDVGFVGITPANELQSQPIWTGPQAAIENVGAVVGIVAQLPVKLYETGVALFTGGERDPNGPMSVVGVGLIAGEVASTDAPILSRVSVLLGLLGSLNIALFVFNLVPLLPLDGGHIVVALWEGVKKASARLFRRPPPKPVDATKLVPVTFVVVVLLIGMGALLLLADVFNPIQLFN